MTIRSGMPVTDHQKQVTRIGARGKDRSTGFVLLVFPFGETEGRCNYISNGVDRKDIVKLLREQANRFDTGTN